MFKAILKFRFLIFVIVAFTLINALAFVGMGIFLSIEGIVGIFKGKMHTEVHPGLQILESLDVFLVALVFFIFAIGIAKLFLWNDKEDQPLHLPSWLNISNFTELKLLLWEAVLTSLVVYFVSDVVRRDGHYTWELLILPASILLLAASILFIKKEH